MPRSILRVSIWNFNLVFKPHVQTNGKPAPLLILFFRQVIVAFVFFWPLYRSYLSNKKNGAGFPFVGWCMCSIKKLWWHPSLINTPERTTQTKVSQKKKPVLIMFAVRQCAASISFDDVHHMQIVPNRNKKKNREGKHGNLSEYNSSSLLIPPFGTDFPAVNRSVPYISNLPLYPKYKGRLKPIGIQQ